jgi:hypothetical protein
MRQRAAGPHARARRGRAGLSAIPGRHGECRCRGRRLRIAELQAFTQDIRDLCGVGISFARFRLMRLFPCVIPLPQSMRVFLNVPSQRSPCVRKAAQARTGVWIRGCFRSMQTLCSPSAAVFCGHHSNNLNCLPARLKTTRSQSSAPLSSTPWHDRGPVVALTYRATVDGSRPGRCRSPGAAG